MSSAIATPEAFAEAQASNVKTLTKAMEDANISDEKDKKEGEDRDGDALEEGEIREEEEEEEEDDGKPKTVFDSATKFNLKHPLYTRWTLYFDSPSSKSVPKTPSTTPHTPDLAGSAYLTNMRKVVSFDSVEEFWGTYNNIVPPSLMPGKANYYLFRNDIQPAWEDPVNKKGGRWAFQAAREKTRPQIDQMWLYTMLAAIGETFETAGDGKSEGEGQVTGVIISARQNFYRIAIWTRQAADLATADEDPLKAKILAIGKFFKADVLGYDDKNKLVPGAYGSEVTFESHTDSEKKGNKNKLVIQ